MNTLIIRFGGGSGFVSTRQDKRRARTGPADGLVVLDAEE